MKYPDGSMIQVGDLIWWEEGHCVGYVQVIAEFKVEYANWGLGEPHIFVSNVHPFDPAMQSGIAYPESFFADEGIELLLPEDRVQLEQAAAHAHQMVATNFKFSTYSVFTDVRDGKLFEWVFIYRDDDGTELGRETVPVN